MINNLSSFQRMSAVRRGPRPRGGVTAVGVRGAQNIIALPVVNEKIESLIRELPGAEGARLFHERVTASDARAFRAFERDGGLLADALALAAWSPLLATTLEQRTDYLAWLARERVASSRVREADELGESLARFA